MCGKELKKGSFQVGVNRGLIDVFPFRSVVPLKASELSKDAQQT